MMGKLDPSNLPPDFSSVMDWFSSTVGRLESAYQELGNQFQTVNRELDDTNRRLEYQQRQLNALLESMSPGVVMVDQELRITVFNRSAERLLGIQERDCLGRQLSDVFPPGSGVGLSLLDALNQDALGGQTERTLHLSGANVPVAVTGNKVIDSEGNFLGAMESFTDLSELKRLQAEMQQDRVLRALGEMAATVAHEIRNPLGGIGGYAGLLARGFPPEDPKRKLLDKIIQGVSSLNKIVSNLLVYTRRTTLQKTQVDVVEWFDSVLSHAEIEIEKEARQIEIVREFPAEPVLVEMDPERFQQVALNLLFNAIQAIEGEGQIYCSIRSELKNVILEIRDSGKGISATEIAQIFTPFFTTKEQGTGLGLAIVRKIVELHEGEITVESEVGKGTCFRISLRIS
jgi:PAS domain S-box-containing protein